MRKLALIVTLLSTWHTASAGTISLSFSPPSVSVISGQMIDFDLLVSGHTPGLPPSVGAFDLDISFNPALLTPTNISFGTSLGNPDLLEALVASTISTGKVNIAEVSLLPPATLDTLQPASFPLATLTFQALANGTATLALTGGVVDDAFGNKLVSIPEPHTLCIAGLTVIALIAKQRRLRNRS
jgi:hypothetical protein